jgi:hypothetical protein
MRSVGHLFLAGLLALADMAAPTLGHAQTASSVPDASALPDMPGIGRVGSLHDAMADDLALRRLVGEFSAMPMTVSYADIRAKMSDILIEWAGQSGVAEPPFSLYSPKRLAALNRFQSTDMEFWNSDKPPQREAAPGVGAATWLPSQWNDLVSMELPILLLQGSYERLQTDFDYDPLTYEINFQHSPAVTLAHLESVFGPMSPLSFDEWKTSALIMAAALSFQNGSKTGYADALDAAGAGPLASIFFAIAAHEVITMTPDGALVEGGRTVGGAQFYAGIRSGPVELQETVPLTATVSGPSIAAPAPPTLFLGTGITPEMVTGSQDAAGDIVYRWGVPGSRVIIEPGALDEVSFANGESWSSSEEIGTSADTGLVGMSAGTWFDPAGFAHSVTTFGDGNTLSYASGYGLVSLLAIGGSTSVAMGPGILPEDLKIVGSPGAAQLAISIPGSHDGLTVTDSPGPLTPLHVTFADGRSVSIDMKIVGPDGRLLPGSVIASTPVGRVLQAIERLLSRFKPAGFDL